MGNRLSEAVIPVQTGIQETTIYTYAATSNRLDTVTDASGLVTYQYDANGNTLADGDNTFIYDDRNRLVEAVDPATQQGVGDYSYNALGQRVVKTTATGTVLFAYDEVGHLLGEYDATGNVIRQYVWRGDRPVAMLKPNGTTVDVYYIHSDHLNTPKVVTDSNQQVVWKADYEPFGDVTETVAAVEMNLRFPGQYEDDESGLNYNYFRTYDPRIGRYLSPDPLGLAGGINIYQYSFSNPLNAIDPSGLKPYEFQVRIGGGVGHIIVGGFVYTATIKDKESGETCNYQIRCIGLGVGLPEGGVTSKPVEFDDGESCSDCGKFEGLGYIGGASALAGGGATLGGGIKIPNGPFISNDYLGFDYGGFKVGVSHNACYFRKR